MIGWLILAIVVLFFAVLLIRTALFRPKTKPASSIPETGIDYERAADHLARMVRVKTVSSRDASCVDEKEFERFRTLLTELYPRVTQNCPRERIGPSGLLYHWKGKNADSPLILMAHYDVVPPGDCSAWKKDPFCGETDADGVLWGRGTLDRRQRPWSCDC